jgi:ABC-type phosphate/phosphonate transport system substrate-binding protein
LTRNPEISQKLRTIAVLGPSPAPPWVIHDSVPAAIRDGLRMEFLAMHQDAEGRHILDSAGILRFERISDSDYDPIREMDRIAETVEW